MSQANNNHDDYKDTKIFVGGLAWETTTDSLKRYFQGTGDVLDANVVSETCPGGRIKSKGYGFVTFRDAESAARACETPFPVIDGRQTNVNLAYIRAKNNNNNTNHSNQNGLPHHQAGPWHQYHNGLLHHQAGPWHQYHNGWWLNQAASHQHQLYPQHTNPHFPQAAYWGPNYGQYHYVYNAPHNPYPTAMVCQPNWHWNWHQANGRPPVRISAPHKGPSIRIEDISETNQEVVDKDDNSEEADTKPDCDVDQQMGKDQEGEICGQDNGIKDDVKDGEVVEMMNGQDDYIKHDVKDGEVEMMSGQDDDIKQDADATKHLDNGIDHGENGVEEEEAENTPQENSSTKQLNKTPQIVIVLEEEAENTPQENGVDHGENGEDTSQGNWIDQEEEGQGQEYMK